MAHGNDLSMSLRTLTSAAGDKDAAGYVTLGFLDNPRYIRKVVPAIRAALARAEEMRALRANATGRDSSPDEAADQRVLWLAVGILAERHRLSPEVAVERLRREALARNIEAPGLAAEVVAGSTALHNALR